MTLDELGADSFDFAAQRLVMQLRRDVRDRALQRDHIRTAAIAMRLNQLQLGFAHNGLDRIAMRIDAERRIASTKALERFKEVDVGIPQRIVRIEDEIQRRLGAPIGRSRHQQFDRTHDGRGSSKSAAVRDGRTTSAPLDGLRPT